MKKLIALMLLVVSCLALVSCSKKQEETQQPAAVTYRGKKVTGQLADILTAGQIVIASEGTWAPWTYHDDNGELTGFDVELARLIAERLGVEIVEIEAEWDGLFGGLDTKRYDLVINGIGYTEERAQKYDYSDGYFFLHTALVVRGDDDRITCFEDLAGMTTANTITSTYAQTAEKYGATVMGVDDLNQTMELLMQGRIDATINDEQAYWNYKNARPDANIKIACLSEEAKGHYIPVRKGETDLVNAINEIIAELIADGTLGELSIKYVGTDMTKQ